jgi:small subunit ribosomal protein S15
MSFSAEQKSRILQDYRRTPDDTGSPEVQVALLSARIEYLTGHFKIHVHDHHSRRGLLRLVSQRRKLLDYLQKVSIDRYQSIISRLGLRK